MSNDAAVNLNSVADTLNNAIRPMFPTSTFRASVRNIIGSDILQIMYMNANSLEQCQSKISYNDPAFIQILFSSNDNGTYSAEATGHYSYKLSETGVKFRKINGKTVQDVAAKVVAWFEKNTAGILALGVGVK